MTRLILVVLSLILVCLVILIAQNRKRSAQVPREPEAVAEVEEGISDMAPTEAPRNEPVAEQRRRQRAEVPTARSPSDDSRSEPQAPPPITEVTPPAPIETKIVVAPVPVPVVDQGQLISTPIRGRVVLAGSPPPEMRIPLDPLCGRLHPQTMETRHYVVGEGRGLANVWVFITNAPRGEYPTPTQQVVLDQIACQYEPYVFAAMINQQVLIRNSDPLLHNVNTSSSHIPAHRFNIAQATQGAQELRFFGQRELPIKFMCNVHPWMFAFAGIFDHPFFAVTDGDGNFEIPAGLPPGRYIVTARHLKAGEVSKEVFVRHNSVSVQFVMKVPARH